MNRNTTPVRIQRKRSKRVKPPNDLPTIYVGPGSKWENPYKIFSTKAGWQVRVTSEGREYVLLKTDRYSDAIRVSVDCYGYMLIPSIINGVLLQTDDSLQLDNIIAELRGKNLSCSCRLDQKCHADVLLKLANDSIKPN